MGVLVDLDQWLCRRAQQRAPRPKSLGARLNATAKRLCSALGLEVVVVVAVDRAGGVSVGGYSPEGTVNGQKLAHYALLTAARRVEHEQPEGHEPA